MSSEQPYTPPSAADEWADLQAPRTQTKQHFLPQSVQDALTPNWHYVGGACIALMGLITLVALASYNPLDPSWNSSGLPLESNWLGGFGAVLADALLQTAGYAVFLIPAFLFMTAWQVAFVKSAPKLLRRLGYLALALVLLSTLLNIFGTPSHWGRPATWGGWLGGVLQYNLNAWLFLPFWATSLLALVPSIMATGSAFGIKESSWSQAWSWIVAKSFAAKTFMQALVAQSASKAAAASGSMGKSLQSGINAQAEKLKQRSEARKAQAKPEPRFQQAGAPLTAAQQGFGQPPAKVQARDATQTPFMGKQHQPIDMQARPNQAHPGSVHPGARSDIMPAPRPTTPVAHQQNEDWNNEEWQDDFAPIPDQRIPNQPRAARPMPAPMMTPAQTDYEGREFEQRAEAFSREPAISRRAPEPIMPSEPLETRGYDDFEPIHEPAQQEPVAPTPEPVMPSRKIPAPHLEARSNEQVTGQYEVSQSPAPLRNPKPVMPQAPRAPQPVYEQPAYEAPTAQPAPLAAHDFRPANSNHIAIPDEAEELDPILSLEDASIEQAAHSYAADEFAESVAETATEDLYDGSYDDEFEEKEAFEDEVPAALNNVAWQQEESILDREEEALLEAQLDKEELQAWEEFAVEDEGKEEDLTATIEPAALASEDHDYSIEDLGAETPFADSVPVSSSQSSVATQPIYSYELPRITYLAPPDPSQHEHRLTPQEAQANAQMLEETLRDFNVKGNIEGVRCGPVVTLYEFEPAPGTKTSRVVGLADDIARSMSVLSARIAVIPGRNVIGIELPNETRETVYFREMLESRAFVEGGFKLPIALGKDIGGEHICVDLAKMPHLLIAGTTGSGKSVAVNTMILSLLYKLTPEQCKFIMVDPKMLELSVYDGIPHMLCPTVIDPKKAVVALNWAVKEMEDRYRAMSQVGVRNIDGFNRRLKEAAANGETILRKVQTGFDPETGQPIVEEQAMDLTPLPYIVIIIDELADLMLVAGKDIEAALQRLAQMARAAGIHLVMATQRPSVDVITGTIKSNFPTRISFHVTSKIDSRTILGEMGAEQLLGMGDMLYMPSGGRIKRVHGPFATDEEVERVVNHLKAQAQPAYIDGITEEDDPEEEGEKGPVVQGAAGMAAPAPSGDEVYDQAVAVVLKHRKVSTSFVQRQLQIGYNRAARLVERMEEEGVISAADHVGRRQILGGAS